MNSLSLPLDFELELLPLLPTWYRDILDYQAICASEQESFDALVTAVVATSDNLFFQTMDEGAVALWEQLFGILAAPSEDLPFRRERVLNRVSTRPPFTLAFLYQKLDALIGPGAWTVSVDYPNYTLYIESSAANQEYATEVEATLQGIKPAHIVYVNRPLLVDAVVVSEEITLSETRWWYTLGSWGLGVNPFASEEERGTIKMPTMPSVQPPMLAVSAQSVLDDTQSVRINGSIIITDLEKTRDENTGNILYTVTAAQTNVITRVELLGSGGAVLSDAAVYVPLGESSANMRHKLLFEEGVANGG